MQILIVDDDSMSRAVMTSIFTQVGKCDEASTGVEAVAAFVTAYKNGNPYDIVMLDITMPVMCGQEALVTMRRIEKERNITEMERTRIIITSGSKDPQTVKNAFVNECDGYMKKPIELHKMLKMLNAIGLNIGEL